MPRAVSLPIESGKKLKKPSLKGIKTSKLEEKLKSKITTPRSKHDFDTKSMGVKKRHKALIVATPAADVTSDSECDRGQGLISTGKRISRRKTLAVDNNRPITVLWPSDDYRSRLELSDREYQEFLLVLNCDDYLTEAGSHDDSIPLLFRNPSSISDSNSIVMTPGLIASTLSVQKDETKSKKSSKKSQSRNRSNSKTVETESDLNSSCVAAAAPSKYLEYDADSDDEDFLQSLSQQHQTHTSAVSAYSNKKIKAPAHLDGLESNVLSCGCFERMISILERELEVSKIFLKEKIRADLQNKVTKELLSDGYDLISQTSIFVREKNGSKIGQIALKKAYDTAVTDAAASRTASIHAAITNISCDVPLTLSDFGVSTDTSSGLSFPAPAVNQLLGIMSRGRGRGVSAGSQGSPRTADAASSSTTVFTSDHLRFLVTEDRALKLLCSVYLEWNPICLQAGEGSIDVDKQKSAKDKKSNKSTTQASTPLEDVVASGALSVSVGSVLSEVYEYWIRKRATRKESLLRCYHNFMMDKWHQQASMPPLPEDYQIDELKRGHYYLHLLRHDLERARVIIDRVRRREKLKKELVKLAGESYDKVTSLSRQFAEVSGGSSSGLSGNRKRAAASKETSVMEEALWQEALVAAKRCRYSLREEEDEQQQQEEDLEGGEESESEELDEKEASSHRRAIKGRRASTGDSASSGSTVGSVAEKKRTGKGNVTKKSAGASANSADAVMTKRGAPSSAPVVSSGNKKRLRADERATSIVRKESLEEAAWKRSRVDKMEPRSRSRRICSHKIGRGSRSVFDYVASSDDNDEDYEDTSPPPETSSESESRSSGDESAEDIPYSDDMSETQSLESSESDEESVRRQATEQISSRLRSRESQNLSSSSAKKSLSFATGTANTVKHSKKKSTVSSAKRKPIKAASSASSARKQLRATTIARGTGQRSSLSCTSTSSEDDEMMPPAPLVSSQMHHIGAEEGGASRVPLGHGGGRRSTYSPQLCSLSSITNTLARFTGNFHN